MSNYKQTFKNSNDMINNQHKLHKSGFWTRQGRTFEVSIVR